MNEPFIFSSGVYLVKDRIFVTTEAAEGDSEETLLTIWMYDDVEKRWNILCAEEWDRPPTALELAEMHVRMYEAQED